MSEYNQTKILKIAKRYANSKRPYLLVNPIQAKHVPTRPGDAICMMRDLGEQVSKKYPDTGVVIAFAETATAIGTFVASCFKDCTYVQTTREAYPSDSDCMCFQEEHSHAVEQKLCKTHLLKAFESTETVILVDDEISTGKTLINIVKEIKEAYPCTEDKQFVSVSIINRLSDENVDLLLKNGIKCECLLKIANQNYDKVVENIQIDAPSELTDGAEFSVEKINMHGVGNPRVGLAINGYVTNCQRLATDVFKRLRNNLKSSKKVLVLGTEEFMYPSLVLAQEIENRVKGCSAFVHATTRSPIGVCKIEGYPIQNGYRLRSFYDNERQTFLYNLDYYDEVIILTDGDVDSTGGLKDVISALSLYGCKNFFAIRSVDCV